MIGSDEHEWVRGAEASLITRAHTSELDTHDSELLRLYAFEEGAVGWAAVEEQRTYPTGRADVFRITYVFVLEAGSWKVVHSHFSAPVPNVEIAGIELSRTLSDLVDSAGVKPDLSALSGTVTLVFTDVVDSTALSRSIGDDAWSRAITAHLESTREIVESEGGSVVKTLGDGGMYSFESGAAALRAAVRIQRAVAEASEPAITLRVGVHTGDVVLAGDDFLGSAVAKAARVASAAEGGQVLVSSTTAGMVNPAEFQFDTPISVELKGLEGTHQLHPLDWSRTRP